MSAKNENVFILRNGTPVSVRVRCKRLSNGNAITPDGGTTYPARLVKTWEQLTDEQKRAEVLAAYERALDGIAFDCAKDPANKPLADEWKRRAALWRDSCLERLVPWEEPNI